MSKVEKVVVTLKYIQALKDWYNALEEGFTFFTKFSLKVTHVTATILQLLAHEKEDEGLGNEDSKLLFKFLAKD